MNPALHAAAPLAARSLRPLALRDGAGVEHLSAASSLVAVGRRLYVVADDEHHLAIFERDDPAPGLLLRLLDDELPLRQRARKQAKPDFESLLHLPASRTHPNGGLLALGSGSRPQRRRAIVLDFDREGGLPVVRRAIDLAPLYDGLAAHFDDLNIEGAFVTGGEVCLLQRGGSKRASASIRYAARAFLRWVDGLDRVPAPVCIDLHDLGAIDGIHLGFTDGAGLPDGGWVYCAAAEDTDNAYDDGRCRGSAIGIVDAQGRHCWQALLEPVCKVEGIAVTSRADGGNELLLVSDADDRTRPALLLAATLPADAVPPMTRTGITPSPSGRGQG